MSIVKRRFFAGFMRSQEKWLNSMADKGYRLIRAGKLEYEFEECEPGQYRYAVEYVGDRSFADEEEYKAFLEEMGYRVFYKNINLDFSAGKLIFRPWADKGGKIATTKTTYNRELLIVEKENDGKEFLLHTDKDDLADYYRRLSYPWYFAIFLTLAGLIVYWPEMIAVSILGGLTVLFALPVIIMAYRIHKIKKEQKLEE